MSTGGFKNLTATKAAKLLNDLNIWDIELSSGIYDKNFESKVKKLILEGNNISFHNYYPRPEIDFVLNLGSRKKEILDRSHNHCINAIKVASKLNIKYYSVHAGFCIDPLPSSLGGDVGGYSVNSLNETRETFLNEIYALSKIASEYNVNLLVENNVTSKTTFSKYKGKKVLLMSDLEDTITLLNEMPKEVGWLCDVAHLKVSANSFNYDPLELLQNNSKHIMGFHLSDNNGLEDTNDPFNRMSWFASYLKPVEYVSIEVYKPLEEIKICWLEAKQIFDHMTL